MRFYWVLRKITQQNQGFYGDLKNRNNTDIEIGRMFLLSNMREIDVSNIRIVLYSPASITAWCEVLNCSEKDLLRAIAIVGNSAKAVDDYLERKKAAVDQADG